MTELLPHLIEARTRLADPVRSTPPAVRQLEIIRAVPDFQIVVHTRDRVADRRDALRAFVQTRRPAPLSLDPRWLDILQAGLGHEFYVIEAVSEGRTIGYLPLSLVESLLFGRYLVSLPYLNSNGALSESPEVRTALVARAIDLAEELPNIKHLELRHEQPVTHPRLNGELRSKVHMRLPLPATADSLWKSFDPKVRNQIRTGEKSDLTVRWGTCDLLDPFYDVLSQNMRDLGTPVYAKAFFETILRTFPGDAELCLVQTGDGRPVAAALLLHGPGVTEVPTASSLREFNASCANMLMYRQLLDRAIERRQSIFDFGRSTTDGPTYKFKKQWGAVAHPAVWQYASKSGSVGEMRPDNPRYRRLIDLWKKLPVPLTQKLGPRIVRGIP
jgi:FemAB-related protein (PEP-CTERM system-associated)